MKYLLDTSVWLWAVGSEERLNQRARRLLRDSSRDIFFSAASAWEIAIKAGLGKLTLPMSPIRYVPERLSVQGVFPMAVTAAHALSVFELPHYHQDPFDRLLIAQAIAEDLTILTADRAFERYPVRIFWCGR